MKDEWLGEEGDFLKLEFLRALTAATDDLLPLGILWYYRRSRYPSRGPADKPARLTHSRWREFDPHLFDYLASLWERGARKLQTVTREHLLGSGVIHFLDDLESPAEPVRVTRPRWCARALEVVGDCRTVVFDPDNGVQPDPGPRLDYTKSRLPHALWSELEAIWNRGSSLIAFQHAPRMKSAEATSAKALAQRIGSPYYPWTLRRGARWLHVLPQPQHRAALEEVVTSFRERWKPFLAAPGDWDGAWRSSVSAAAGDIIRTGVDNSARCH